MGRRARFRFDWIPKERDQNPSSKPAYKIYVETTAWLRSRSTIIPGPVDSCIVLYTLLPSRIYHPLKSHKIQNVTCQACRIFCITRS